MRKLTSLWPYVQFPSTPPYARSSDHPFLFQIVVPNEHNLKKLLDSSPDYSSKNVDFDALCKDKKVREIVMVELNNVGKKAGLKGMEVILFLFLLFHIISSGLLILRFPDFADGRTERRRMDCPEWFLDSWSVL